MRLLGRTSDEDTFVDCVSETDGGDDAAQEGDEEIAPASSGSTGRSGSSEGVSTDTQDGRGDDESVSAPAPTRSADAAINTNDDAKPSNTTPTKTPVDRPINTNDDATPSNNDPTPPKSPVLAANELRICGDFDGALAALSAAPHTDCHEWLWFRSRLASDLAENRRSAHPTAADDAVALAERSAATEAGANCPESHLALAVACGRCTEAPGVATKDRIAFSRRIKTALEDTLRLCDASFAEDDDDVLLTRYTALMVLGKWHYALSSLGTLSKAAIRVAFGKMPEASFDLGAECHRRQLQMRPALPMPRLELARCLVAMGKKAEAASHLRTFLEQAPDNRYCAKRPIMATQAKAILQSIEKKKKGFH